MARIGKNNTAAIQAEAESTSVQVCGMSNCEKRNHRQRPSADGKTAFLSEAPVGRQPLGLATALNFGTEV